MCMFGIVRMGNRQRDLERLAWAGGFFDGEGSTMTKTESSRPADHQLNLSVAQSGGAEVPEVLTRFQTAMGGMGTIGRHSAGVYQRRAADRNRAHATAALLRLWTGPVKRHQAALAIATVA